MHGKSLSLGELVRTRRVQLGLTQEQLAEMIGDDDQMVRQSDISRIESGRVELPRLERLQRLATALELPFGVLLFSSNWAGQEWKSDAVDVRSLAAGSSGNGVANGSRTGQTQPLPSTRRYPERTRGERDQTTVVSSPRRFEHRPDTSTPPAADAALQPHDA